MGVNVTFADSVYEVCLDWPEARNSLGPAEAEELAAAIEEIADKQHSALVLTGNKAFCVGGNLKTFSRISLEETTAVVRDKIYRAIQRPFRALRQHPVPTLAALDGPAIGLGMDLALACDVRIVGSAGWMALGWNKMGLIPAGGGIAFMHSVKSSLVWELLLLDKRLDAAECERLGLAESSGTMDARERAWEIARSLRSLSPLALKTYSELDRQCRWPDDKHLQACLEAQADLIKSEDFRNRAGEFLNSTKA